MRTALASSRGAARFFGRFARGPRRAVAGRLALAFLSIPMFGLSAQPALTFDAAVASRYLDRGELLSDAPVLQAALDVAADGLSFNVWGNMDLTDDNGNGGDITVAEMTLAHGFEIDPLNLAVGVSQYLFPDQPGTREVFAHAALRMPLNPEVGVYYDFDLVEGIYLDAGVHHTAALSPTVAVELRAALGYGDAAANQDAFGHERDALRDLIASIKLLFMPERRTMLSAGGQYWSLMDPDLRDTVEAAGRERGGVIWKVAVQHNF